ncbi:WGR domain-containing protein [Bradyrhizobium japonicum]|uniref:WGR domain-containing protein n=1 Tax=Bradyrhizobium japonicum TaxID=375 RepID=UPI003D9C4B2F
MRRFYALSTQLTLFGEMSLIRHWGRIGTSGKTMVRRRSKHSYAWSVPSGGAVTLSWTKNRLSLTIFRGLGSACDGGSICFAALMPDQGKIETRRSSHPTKGRYP